MYSVAGWLVGTMKELGKQLQNTPHSSRNLEDTGALYMLRGMLANGSLAPAPRVIVLRDPLKAHRD